MLLTWKTQAGPKSVEVSYQLFNSTDRKFFLCVPDPPYVTINADRSVRIWMGMYVLGPQDLVEAPIVPPVVSLGTGESYRGAFVLKLPLDEIHPFPRHEYAKKNPATSKSVRLEIGVFPADERYPPPVVTKDGRERMVAPYGWASQTIHYVVGERKGIELPILCLEIEQR
jgi:hypothetical protein